MSKTRKDVLMEVKEKILKMLHTVEREGMDKLIDWLEKSDFFNAPASTKYHSNFEGGLAEHSLKVTELFEEKCKKFNNDISKDSVYICGLLHDVCKVNFYTKGLKNVKEGKKINYRGQEVGNWIEKEVWEIKDTFPAGHGSKSVIILQNFIKLTQFEILAILYHMGLPEDYISKMAYSQALELYPELILLHTSDEESTYMLEETKK
jgi:HD superfamily phosphohydrolase YqeK